MSTKHAWTAALLCCALALRAQEPVITAETPANSVSLHQWLHSGDPRLIAWAADFGRRNHDAAILAEMPSLLEHDLLPPPLTSPGKSQADQHRAVQAILDALIQENVLVPVDAIKAVAEVYPSQAAILIGRLPLDESRSTLSDWTYGATGSWSGRTLARIATMMLAKSPDPSLVADLVAASEEHLQLHIRTDGAGGGIGTGPACGDFMGTNLTPGWPQVYTYDLVENDSQSGTMPLIELAGDRIASRRFEENRPWGSCYGVLYLNAVTRHRLIAYWLDVSPTSMAWQPNEYQTIVWTSKDDYGRQLGAIVEAERRKLQATVDTLKQRGLLVAGQGSLLRMLQGDPTLPKLVLTVQCDIKPCPLDEP